MSTWKFYFHLHFQYSISQLVLLSFFECNPSPWLHISIVNCPTNTYSRIQLAGTCTRNWFLFLNQLLSNVNMWMLKLHKLSSNHVNYIAVADVLQWKTNHWRQYYRWKFCFGAVPAPAQQHHLAGAKVLGVVPTWKLLLFPAPFLSLNAPNTNPECFEFPGIQVLKEFTVRTSVDAFSWEVFYALNMLLAGFSSLLLDKGLILSFAFCNKSLFFFSYFQKELNWPQHLRILLKSALELSLHFRMAEIQQTKLW